jgi:hypothetical protein
MTQKQLLQGAGDGTAVPAGYIGEKISSVVTNATAPATGTGFVEIVARTITLSRGSYIALAYVAPSGFTGNVGLLDVFINSGTNSPSVSGGVRGSSYSPANVILAANCTAFILVTADSSTITLSCRATSSSTMSGTVSLGSDFQAVRIA